MVTEEAPTTPCLDNFMGSLRLTPTKDVAAWCLEGSHSRIAANRARMGREWELTLPIYIV